MVICRKRIALSLRMGELIRNLRLAQQLSQEAFATRCDLHRTYIGAIERGEKTITIETADKLATGLGLSLSELFTKFDNTKG
jgi:transcriptional regulator with XRE-family HTH domain